MSRNAVRHRLGEPKRRNGEDNRWIYDGVTVMFDETDAVQGWLVTADNTSIRKNMRNVMIALNAPARARPPARVAARRPLAPPVLNKSPKRGGSRSIGLYGGSGYRRPLDRILDRRNTSSRRHYGTYRRPAFLREMFRSRSKTGRQRRTDPYARNRY